MAENINFIKAQLENCQNPGWSRTPFAKNVILGDNQTKPVRTSLLFEGLDGVVALTVNFFPILTVDG